MSLLKRALLISLGFLIVLVISSCGSSTSAPSSPPSNTPSSASTPSSSTSNNSSPASTGSTTVQTATATVNGKSETILTNAQGMTLYYFTPDSSTKAACTGGCASTWPPLIFTGNGDPTSSVKLSGSLEIYPNANGKQVTYNDHPLYTYSGDTASGQTKGNGIGGQWFVATVDLTHNTTV